MVILYLALLWIPFSMAYLIFDSYGVTWTFYLFCIALLSPYAVFRYFTGKRFSVGFVTDQSVIGFTLLFFFSLFFFEAGSNEAYRFVHGVLVPCTSYFVIKALVTTEKRYVSSLKAILLGASVYALGIILYYIVTDSNSRLNNVFSRDSITTAALATWGTLFAVYTPLFKTKLVKYTVIAINASGILISLSRGLLVAMLSSPFWVSRFAAKRMSLLFALFIGASFVVTVVLISNVQLFEPKNWDPSLENSAARLINIDYWKRGIHGRVHSFESSMERFKEAPVFGNGFPDRRGSTVHNFHMELLEYSGLLGYFLFCVIFISHFWSAKDYFKRDRYLLVGAIFIVYMLINGVFNGVLHGVAPLLVFIQLGLNESRLQYLKRMAKPAKMMRGRYAGVN